MRTTPLVLAGVAVVMILVLGWRLTGGPLGPRSYAFIALTVAVLVAALISWRRAPRSTTTGPG